LEGHKILEVAGNKIRLSFSVLRKSRFLLCPNSLLFSGYWWPFPGNKNGGR